MCDLEPRCNPNDVLRIRHSLAQAITPRWLLLLHRYILYLLERYATLYFRDCVSITTRNEPLTAVVIVHTFLLCVVVRGILASVSVASSV